VKISAMESVAKVEDREADGRDGPVHVRIFSPKTEGPLPVIVYYHGGGWVYGNIESSEAFCRKLANVTGAIVASVEYRLAPEHKFPIPLHDCYDATKWVAKNAGAFLGDPNKLVVCGDSAGGNLAAAVALMNQKEKAFSIAGQLLIYPILTTDLIQEYYDDSPDKAIISLQNMQFFIDAYLSSPEDSKNPYAAPLKSKNLAQLPSCFIVTAEYDALKHEGARYREALDLAGTQVQHKCYPGVIHGFLGFPLAESVREEAMGDIKDWVNDL
jgi:acetyl esterase